MLKKIIINIIMIMGLFATSFGAGIGDSGSEVNLAAEKPQMPQLYAYSDSGNYEYEGAIETYVNELEAYYAAIYSDVEIKSSDSLTSDSDLIAELQATIVTLNTRISELEAQLGISQDSGTNNNVESGTDAETGTGAEGSGDTSGTGTGATDDSANPITDSCTPLKSGKVSVEKGLLIKDKEGAKYELDGITADGQLEMARINYKTGEKRYASGIDTVLKNCEGPFTIGAYKIQLHDIITDDKGKRKAIFSYEKARELQELVFCENLNENECTQSTSCFSNYESNSFLVFFESKDFKACTQACNDGTIIDGECILGDLSWKISQDITAKDGSIKINEAGENDPDYYSLCEDSIVLEEACETRGDKCVIKTFVETNTAGEDMYNYKALKCEY